MSPAFANPSLPAIGLIMAPGRRARSLELACEIERRGFPAIWCPGGGNAMAACQAILAATNEIVVGIGIQSIYARDAADLGAQAAFLHEMYGGRFRLGLGVAHRARSPLVGTNVRSHSPLSDMRSYVQDLRSHEKASGPLPPIVLAALRDKMVDLALDVADGAVWANGSRSDMSRAVGRIPPARRAEGFTVANMIPAVIDDDPKAALAVTRRTMGLYLGLPNYRNYWRAVGFADEMDVVEAAIAQGTPGDVTAFVSDRFLRDVTFAGTARQTREDIASYISDGLGTPIVVPSAVAGGQFRAFELLFEAFA